MTFRCPASMETCPARCPPDSLADRHRLVPMETLLLCHHSRPQGKDRSPIDLEWRSRTCITCQEIAGGSGHGCVTKPANILKDLSKNTMLAKLAGLVMLGWSPSCVFL